MSMIHRQRHNKNPLRRRQPSTGGEKRKRHAVTIRERPGAPRMVVILPERERFLNMTFSKEFYDSLEPTVCCICGKTFYAPYGIGNSPDPVYPALELKGGDGKLFYECCDHCANTTVIQARIKGMEAKQEKTAFSTPESRMQYVENILKGEKGGY